MNKRLWILILPWILFANEPKTNHEFGYISHSTINIGDDFQAIAAMRFLPKNAIGVDREFISQFEYPTLLHTVVSGWFMHTKMGYWELTTPPPEKAWPPSNALAPFFISFHISPSFFSEAFTEEGIEYLKNHAPIGARDLPTLRILQEKGIPSYFSGCLTLTLENPFKERDEIIYLVDVDDEVADYIKKNCSSPIVRTTQGKPLLHFLSKEHRLKYAEYILNLYRKAKCVITTRLHVALPCLAFETPLLVLSEPLVDPRFDGLIEHIRHCSKKDLLEEKASYNFDNPPPNFNTHLKLRTNLIKTMEEYVDSTEHDSR